MSMRLTVLASMALLTGLLQGCFPNAFSGDKAGVLVAQDRRAEDARRDDREIESRAIDLVYKNTEVFMHVNATSFNRKVLLSGEVPDESTKAELEKTVTSIELVTEVHNELTVAANSSLLSRSNDSRLTSSVKMMFVADKRFDSNVIRVMVENNTVYLMGLVYRSEAEAAAEVASSVKGVQRVVKLFEYLN
jgi:osmotically-inducible protein OsmY